MVLHKKRNFFLIFLILLSCTTFFHAKSKSNKKYKKIINEYKEIQVEDICLDNKKIKKADFLFGVGTSAYQVEGSSGATQEKYNQWMARDGEKVTVEIGGKKQEKIISKPGNACEHWERYKEDIKLIKNLGCNAYRFSISWAKVEPKEGEFNKKALDHYEDVCKELKKNGIRPLITLYYYAHPVWFEKKGAFEKSENINCFVNYGTKVFELLNKYNPIWFSINTFTGCSFHAYYFGTKPPFKKDMGLALQVLKNVLDAHVQFYKKAKTIDKNSTIGIHKIILPIEKYRSWQFWDGFGIDVANRVNHEAICEFFTKGELNINLGVPALYIKDSILYKNDDAIGALDCVGLNHYSSAYMSNFKLLSHSKCIPTQSKLFTICPQGFYTALHQISQLLAKPLGVPIYVTENGIATDNEEHRDVFFRSYLQSLSKAMQDGVDVRGYIAWSLMDNFDWLDGYNFNYGLYSVDRKTQERTLKDGASFFVDVIKNTKNQKIQKNIA